MVHYTTHVFFPPPSIIPSRLRSEPITKESARPESIHFYRLAYTDSQSSSSSAPPFDLSRHNETSKDDSNTNTGDDHESGTFTDKSQLPGRHEHSLKTERERAFRSLTGSHFDLNHNTPGPSVAVRKTLMNKQLELDPTDKAQSFKIAPDSSRRPLLFPYNPTLLASGVDDTPPPLPRQLRSSVHQNNSITPLTRSTSVLVPETGKRFNSGLRKSHTVATTGLKENYRPSALGMRLGSKGALSGLNSVMDTPLGNIHGLKASIDDNERRRTRSTTLQSGSLAADSPTTLPLTTDQIKPSSTNLFSKGLAPKDAAYYVKTQPKSSPASSPSNRDDSSASFLSYGQPSNSGTGTGMESTGWEVTPTQERVRKRVRLSVKGEGVKDESGWMRGSVESTGIEGSTESDLFSQTVLRNGTGKSNEDSGLFTSQSQSISTFPSYLAIPSHTLTNLEELLELPPGGDSRRIDLLGAVWEVGQVDKFGKKREIQVCQPREGGGGKVLLGVDFWDEYTEDVGRLRMGDVVWIKNLDHKVRVEKDAMYQGRSNKISSVGSRRATNSYPTNVTVMYRTRPCRYIDRGPVERCEECAAAVMIRDVVRAERRREGENTDLVCAKHKGAVFLEDLQYRPDRRLLDREIGMRRVKKLVEWVESAAWS